MSDLFQQDVPDSYIEQVVHVMQVANWHTYQVLTKRAERLRDFLATRLDFASKDFHLWWGGSLEDRKYGIPRINFLRETPTRVRFLSIEPLLEDLGEIDLTGIHWVIVGGESGYGARPMAANWARSILRQCRAANVPFFFKQWCGFHKAKTGRLFDGRTFDEMPPRTNLPMPPRAQRLAMLREFTG